MPPSGDNRNDAAGKTLFRAIRGIIRPIAALAVVIVSHGPEASVALSKEREPAQVRIQTSCRNGSNAGGDLFGAEDDRIGGPIAQLTIRIVPHSPETAIGFHK